ncbi:carbohydrate metabolic process [Pyrenophora seminiperda CCB06]|uniref:Carbohydrate metabolic process n=1 Tax=Pyrenophora seminiperda CCB06 TaxID=1302712 RepID=A0A3M7LZB4_9PLEO|nr:carbohydrate metabolic process [Pyrenophora seminiperda CCB06]
MQTLLAPGAAVMSHSSSRAALRLLSTVLLAASIANAAALPSTNQLSSTSDVEATLAGAVAPNSNIFDEIAKILRLHDGVEVVNDFFSKLLGYNNPDSSDGEATVTVTVTVAPSPSMVMSHGSLSSSSASISTAEASTSSEPSPSTEPVPSSSDNDIFSILPFGPLTTAINLPLSTPISPSSVSSPVPVLPPYPANASLATVSATATAILITGYFPTNPLETSLPHYNSSITTTSTSTLTTTELVSVILVTGTGAVGTVGTGLPIPSNDAAAPLWTNSTSAPTATETGAAAATLVGTGTPLFPNTTIVVPIIVNATGSPGTSVDVTLPIELPTPTTASAAIGTGIVAATGASEVGYGSSPTLIPPYGNDTAGMWTSVVLGTGFMSTSTSTSTSTTTVLAVPTDVVPVPVVPVVVNGSVVDAGPDADVGFEDITLLQLTTFCTTLPPWVTTLTLPLLSHFYSASNPSYPVLASFPGCIPGTPFPNCTALGQVILTCQSAGRKVLLSVKASGIEAVGGNAWYGDPDVSKEPFGPSFGSPGGAANGGGGGGYGGKGNVSNSTQPQPPVYGFGSGNATAGGPVAVVEPRTPSSRHTHNRRASAHNSPGPRPMYQPNLLTPTNTPDTLAATLLSLFGPVSVADESLPRPLGPSVVLDGFDVQVPVQWKGTYQDEQFHDLLNGLKGVDEDEDRKIKGLEVLFGWVGEVLG